MEAFNGPNGAFAVHAPRAIVTNASPMLFEHAHGVPQCSSVVSVNILISFELPTFGFKPNTNVIDARAQQCIYLAMKLVTAAVACAGVIATPKARPFGTCGPSTLPPKLIRPPRKVARCDSSFMAIAAAAERTSLF